MSRIDNYRIPSRVFASLSALRDRRMIAFLRRSTLLIGFAKRCPALTVESTPDWRTLRLNRRMRFSFASLPSLRVT